MRKQYLNRFAVFSGAYNLMMGGAKDFKESLSTKQTAEEMAKEIARDECFARWVQIFDKVTDQITTYRIVDGELKQEECE
ncbi:hypothetical protein ACJJH9_00175 (plasmid) [Microbulbifer sp. DLAB2-AF]|uniref:hypothetical protein n=1 Tax=Microbulbifer sp. DLAB2-AF TaxID=3243395 RepID=UPI0040394A2E